MPPALPPFGRLAAFVGLLAATLLALVGSAATAPSALHLDATLAPLALAGTTEAAQLAAQIAAGHAFDKHVVAERQFPGITTRAEFAALLERIIAHPSAARRLSHDRSAYWDEETGTVVITNPHDRDGGTAFRPRAGRAYFDNLR